MSPESSPFLHEFKGGPGTRNIPLYMVKDLDWWHKFLQHFNGVTMFPESRWLPPDTCLSTDSCLQGCGRWSEGEYFHCSLPADITECEHVKINELECLAVVIAIKAWKHKINNKNVLLLCDNASTVQVINKGMARNKFTQACLRELAWLTATNNSWIKMCFVPGVSNHLSDFLSRWETDRKYPVLFKQETQGVATREVKIQSDWFYFANKW